MIHKVGFIGGGALAESIVRGICGKVFAPNDIFIAEIRPERCEELITRYGVNASTQADFLDAIDLLIVAVKPKDAEKTFAALQGKVPTSTIITYTIAGLKLASVEEAFPANKIVRIMPNVAVSVAESMTAYTLNERAAQVGDAIKKFWSTLGRAVEVEERLMDAVTGLSGSGPAYAFLMIDALSDGGVAAGLPRAQALELAAQTLLGAAKMVLQSGEHPDALRDKVTSPAGTTIEGVRVLERGGFRSSLIEAVLAATEKSKTL
ncbi:MAG: pyrroline-5-carboxylate reductase [Selenomonadaceae bacterium]|nr:pyrroline-5-carboxylate reductase [Selenomonadaceae bacterium]